ncbi:MAG: nickel pincer cofactor biosynthesis protein LarB [Lentisphaeria bacterium]|nr:nickel pincer cofactor biosynthesis protein LarB [Lentisphaeria bacterium]
MDKFKDVGFAKLDMTRRERTGCTETVYCPGKNCEQLAGIFAAFCENNVPVLGTKCTLEQYEFVKERSLDVSFDSVSKILTSNWGEVEKLPGLVAVCTGGTADIPVAEEACRTAEFFGCDTLRCYDVGVAGLHRLMGKIDEIRRADVVIAVAGMEGALGSVLSGLVSAPMIAVPTSVGYGASFGGVAPLLAMLNSCAEGMAVVNIDNGFGAGVMACRILRKINRK